MRWTRLEICNYITQRWGNLYNKESDADKTALLMGLDMILEDLSTTGQIPILKKHGFINAIAEYATGTITIATADGVSTVTGLLTVWTADMIGRKLIIDSDDIAYTVKTVSSATVLTLEEIYINQSDDTNTLSTASSYTIVKDTYKLARDFGSFAADEIYNLNSNYELIVRDSVEFDKENPSRASTGNPLDIVLRGLSEDTYYNTGTVAVTKGSATITGSSTVWTAQMNGLPFRVIGNSAEYIFTYISATSGTLDRIYEGTTASADTYQIEFPGLMLCQFDPKPKKPILVNYFYYRTLNKLISDNDICLLPFQNGLIAGGMWQYSLIKPKKEGLDPETLYKIYETAKAALKVSRWHIPNQGYKPRLY